MQSFDDRLEKATADMMTWWQVAFQGAPDIPPHMREIAGALADAVSQPLAMQVLAEAYGISLEYASGYPRLLATVVRLAYALGTGRVAPYPPPVSPLQLRQFQAEKMVVDACTAGYGPIVILPHKTP
jgi:hypothetical protein